MTNHKAFWTDATAEECCATCARSDGERCRLCGITFGAAGLYDKNETKCTAFKPEEAKA